MATTKKITVIFLLLALSAVAIIPLTLRGYYPMHDDVQPTRVYEMAKSLSEGQFPVRWVPDLGYGYGYPLFNFYAPLPYYVGALAFKFGIGAIAAAKIMTAIGVLLAGVGMWYAAAQLLPMEGAFVAGLLYMFAPYHAAQIYVRGAIGELWAYAAVPVALGALFALHARRKYAVLILAFSIAYAILSHNITGMLLFTAIFLLGIVFSIQDWFKTKKITVLKHVGMGLLLGVGLAAFFWLPAVVEAKYTAVHTLIEGTNNFRDHFVYVDQLWNSPWGFAGSAPGRADGMSFRLGKIHIVLGVIGAVIWIYFSSQKKQKIYVFLSILMTLGAIFLMLNVSRGIWEFFPFLAYVQYPWRFLTFVSCGISLLGAAVFIPLIKQKWFMRYGMIALIISILLATSGKLFVPQYLNTKVDADYTDAVLVHWQHSKISDEYMPNKFPIPQNPTEVIRNNLEVSEGIELSNVENLPSQLHLTAASPNGGEVRFFHADFPGWKYIVDGKIIHPDISLTQTKIQLAPGEHQLTAYLSDTPVRTISNLISLLSGSIVVLYLIHLKRGAYEKKS